jgi:hypothetical protein
MLLSMKRYLALLAAVVMTGALGSGCSAKKDEAATAKAQVSVQMKVIADVTRIQLTITGNGQSPIIADLTKASAGNVWTANVSSIPANATGVNYTFTAEAFQGATKIYEGATIATVIAGQTAKVIILLQELNVPPGPTNYAPVITSITATNSYVLPGQGGTFAVTAADPDHNGEPLTYAWSAKCDAGTLTLGSPTAATTSFTAPGVNALCAVTITVSETSTAANNSSPLSVTTYFTLAVNANFGSADIFAFPNSYPVVSVRGDFRYNFFSDVVGQTVGQNGDLFFSAFDPDGDNLRFDLSAQCGDALNTANGTLTSGAVAVASNQFSAVGFNSKSPATWSPTFGYPAPVSPFANPAKDCIFTVVVHDLCTGGNCGTAAADGSNKVATVGGAPVTSSTTGIINAIHPAQPKRAPSITRVFAPNQLGPVAVGVQTWDAPKIAIIDPNKPYNLTVEALDTYEAGPLSVLWSCNTGSAPPAGTLNTTSADPKYLKSLLTWTSPNSLIVGMACTATFTSAASGLSTVATFQFAGSDPCVGVADATACVHANKCLSGTTCLAGVCQGGTAQTCTAADQCHVAGTCDANTGVCSNPNAADATLCNADGNGCTQADACLAGVCTAGPAVSCTTPPNSYCYAAGPGTCATTSASTFTCNYVPAATTVACTAANATAKCNGTSTFAGFACDGAGACVGSGSVACGSTQCATGGACSATTGACAGAGPLAAGTLCNDANNCTGTVAAPDKCDGNGSCVGGAFPCAAGDSCTPNGTGFTCLHTTQVTPVVAWDLQLSPPAGVAMDAAGNTYAAGNIFTNVAVDFASGRYPALAATAIPLKSAGGVDAFLAKYDASGSIVWATTVADDVTTNTNDQTATGAAVTANATAAVIGKVIGKVTFGTSVVNASAALPYVGAFDVSGAAPARKWAAGYDLGANGVFKSIAANPNHASNRIAVCGLASGAASGLVPSAVYGGATDLVLAVFDSAGTLLWSTQLGGAGNETCSAVTVDDNGDVFATGQFDGASLTFPAASPITLTGPGTTARKFIWVAKFAGAGSAGGASTLAAVAYNGTLGVANPVSLAVAATGDVVVGGSFGGNLTIGAAMASAGSDDAFVAKLNGITLAPAWNALRFGGTGVDIVKGVAVTSLGDIVVTGNFAPSSASVRAANGGVDTSGAVKLLSAGAADMFVAKFNGGTGATDGAAAYGDAGTQNGDGMAVNRFGATPDGIAFVGTISGTFSFGAVGPVTAAGGTDVGLVFAKLQ